MLLLFFKYREWLIITTLNNIIHDKNDKCGSFEFLRPQQQMPTFEQGKILGKLVENVKEVTPPHIELPFL